MPLPYPVIQLKKSKERSLLQRHPWVFSGAIAKEPPSLENGDLVQVHSAAGEYLATGHFHRATITVRCLDFDGNVIDEFFLRNKIRNCLTLRKNIHLPNYQSNCFRLIHGEGDGFPGLIADVYGNTLVLQSYTAGMHKLKTMLLPVLKNELSFIDAIYDKSNETMSKHGISTGGDEFLFRKPDYKAEEFVIENGIKYSVDFIGGQKTGFFLDQRDNRQLLRHYSEGKSVLNTFCYTGGFSLASLNGMAQKVVSIDSSARAMEGLDRNLLLNQFKSIHSSVTADAMAYLKSASEMFDIVILDPPAFAKHLNQTSNAIIGYRNLNTAGFRHVKPGGLLFTFSCSQAVDRELFRKIIFQSALQAGREVKILHHLSQPPDHPVSIYHPEGEYLKGLVLMVE